MQKFTTVFSVPLAELDEQLADVASWPTFLPEVESVTELSNGRYTFCVRQDGRTRSVDVAVRRSPHGSGMIWTVLDGPAWNGHLYLQVVDGRRTRVHLELNIEPFAFPEVVEVDTAGERPAPQLSLFRLRDALARHGDDRDDERVVEIPA
jgi:Polyketide cyclase / dehydrase and lipid transport